MEFISKEGIKVLKADFQDSHQLLWDENSSSQRVTITKFFVHPGKVNGRHQHPHSEQIQIARSGKGTLLLEGEKTIPFEAGDVIRFEDEDTHGIFNDSAEEFCYLSVTAPPINFRYAYDKEEQVLLLYSI